MQDFKKGETTAEGLGEREAAMGTFSHEIVQFGDSYNVHRYITDNKLAVIMSHSQPTTFQLKPQWRRQDLIIGGHHRRCWNPRKSV